jgi:adenylate cyclase
MKFSLVAVCIIAVILFIQSQKIELLDSFSQRFNDINFYLQKKHLNPDVVVVSIDEKSINRFGRWPWRRDIIAKGISKLQDTKVVGFDMVFSEKTDYDKELSSAVASLNSSVCGFFFRTHATQDLTNRQRDILQDSSLDLLQSNLTDRQSFLKSDFAELSEASIMTSCTMEAFFSTITSSDKLYRFYPSAFYLDNSLYPSLGIQILRVALNSDIDIDKSNVLLLNKERIHINNSGFTQLNFYAKEEYKALSFLDLYEGKIDEQVLKNKIVLFGVTEMGVGDVVPTPIGNIYGVFVHQTFLSNFLNHELIWESQLLNQLISIVMVLAVLMFVLSIKKLYVRIFAYIFFYLLLFFIAKVLFVTQNIYIDMFYPLLSILLSALVEESVLFYVEEKNTRFIKKAFSNYLSKELLHKLVEKEEFLQLGGERKELSILFSDIRNFTALSEDMNDPQKLIQLLNRYFTPMTEAVLRNRGMVDKYIGDAIMAFFNAPVDVENHAKAACDSALEMIANLASLNEELAEDQIAPIEIGIGINTGEVVVGNMGATERFNYTIIGDSVNLASRLEAKTKEYKVEIIISSFTYELVKDFFEFKNLGFTDIKGKKERIEIYQLISKKEML